MIIMIILTSLISSYVAADISQKQRCIAEKSETRYCKEKLAKEVILSTEE